MRDAGLLRIALDGTPLTEPTGGVRRYVEELNRALRDTFPEDRYYLVSDQLSAPQSAVERRWWLIGLRRELERIGVDLFHGTDFAVPYVRSKPSVMTLHDLSPWREATREAASRRVRRRTPWMLRLGMAKMVITPSEAVRRETMAKFRLAADRVVAVPLAASVFFRPVPVASPGRPYFLYVGTIEARKNIGRVVDAWREVAREAEVDLVLAGRVRDPIDGGGARLMGTVAEQDLPSLYSGAVAVVYPSLYEGFGLPVLEAMQCGAAVITSKDPAIREVAGGAALEADAHDAREWIEAMRSLLTAETRREWGERGLRRAAEFSWEKTARNTREVYVEALRRS